MKYRKYFRKTSLKQKGHGETFLKEVLNKKPKFFLEIGVFHGVTARNICELLYQIHGIDFKYVGLDLFEKSDQNKFEVIPSTDFKNPFKKFYHQYITRQDPYSIEAVSNLLKKFKNQVHLIQGNSNQVLKKMDMSKIDFVFLDGGHEYNTVVNDLNSCIDVLKFNGSILCDDYNLGSAPGVKKAIDEFVKNNNFNCKIFCDDRFALIEN
ncbi:class I SAM-dependent methyltransferase [Candidatus Pelagibacter bacterium nBUS_44]|uniref:class I SAM-dependent methyltransferase n=1 Tax=Candidatus Pelagibacter bacterium nBUS_44 TaxID=3374195 RepID=UPI003EBC40BE